MQTGAGVVADSDPDVELAETNAKAGRRCCRPSLDAEASRFGGRPVILVVDHYDSFTYNLVQLFESLGRQGPRW